MYRVRPKEPFGGSVDDVAAGDRRVCEPEGRQGLKPGHRRSPVVERRHLQWPERGRVKFEALDRTTEDRGVPGSNLGYAISPTCRTHLTARRSISVNPTGFGAILIAS